MHFRKTILEAVGCVMDGGSGGGANWSQGNQLGICHKRPDKREQYPEPGRTIRMSGGKRERERLKVGSTEVHIHSESGMIKRRMST